VELKNILSEVTQVQKTKGCIFSLECGILIQYKYKQYYDKQVTQRGDCISEKDSKRRKLKR
jgi:hypothetical protein